MDKKHYAVGAASARKPGTYSWYAMEVTMDNGRIAKGQGFPMGYTLLRVVPAVSKAAAVSRVKALYGRK